MFRYSFVRMGFWRLYVVGLAIADAARLAQDWHPALSPRYPGVRSPWSPLIEMAGLVCILLPTGAVAGMTETMIRKRDRPPRRIALTLFGYLVALGVYLFAALRLIHGQDRGEKHRAGSAPDFGKKEANKRGTTNR